MSAKDTQRRLFTLIKVISVFLISSAIGLELWNINALLSHTEISDNLHPIFLIERLAITTHLVEGVIAAFYAASRKKLPVRYGIYTFFVGTVGLLELFEQ